MAGAPPAAGPAAGPKEERRTTTATTTLPPGVSGRAQGELVLAVHSLTWHLPAARRPTHAPLLLARWWGDAGEHSTSVSATQGESLSFQLVAGKQHALRYLRDAGSVTVALQDYQTLQVSALRLCAACTNSFIISQHNGLGDRGASGWRIQADAICSSAHRCLCEC
jgi:hypothetical protein